jgi:hypothetical protein
MSVRALAATVVLTLAATTVAAQERTLTERHPLRLGDAFPVGLGEGSVLAAGGVTVPRRGAAQGFFPLDVLYSPIRNAQFSVGTEINTDPRASDDPASGDLTLAGRVNFGPPTSFLPSFATQLAATVPTGVGSRPLDLEAKGYATRQLTLGEIVLFLHLNASADVRATALGEDERRVRYHLAAGPSFTVPQLAALTLGGDVFVDQARRRGETETVGAEVGARYRLSPTLVFDAGVGTEWAGPRDRAAFFALVGLSWSFTTPQKP